MIDLEATLREHLERRAAAIQIHPDIDAVIDDNTLITVDAKSASRPGRRIWLTLAAAVLVALFAVGMLALDRERSTPSDQPRDLSRRPLANGVIVVGRSEAEGLVAVDPDSAGRIGQRAGASWGVVSGRIETGLRVGEDRFGLRHGHTFHHGDRVV